ncbi:MAG: domain protein putative component of TonB system [Myxococcaceae bacterium]|nr:domain protein putative component of TonB system [Myxococcaceae bacterium]
MSWSSGSRLRFGSTFSNSRRGNFRRYTVCLAFMATLAAQGCGARGKPAQSAASVALPAELDAQSFTRIERAYRRLDPSDPQRPAIRERLVHYLLGEAEGAHRAEEYDASVELLASITSLYRPEELAAGLVPGLLPLANYLRVEGERRGDEGRVLSALWIQARLAHSKTEPEAQYQLLRRWSDEARRDLGGVGEHLKGLIDVMAEHARLTPAPEVLDRLAQLYADRRSLLLSAMGPEGEAPAEGAMLSREEFRDVSVTLARAPLDIAGVYLLHDEFTKALDRLGKLQGVTGLEPRIRTIVEIVAFNKTEAPSALLALSRVYNEMRGFPVAGALCLYGVRTFTTDARFPQCLGRLAALEDDYAEAAAEYADAVKLAPEERELYDEALEVLANLMRGEMFDGDPSETRSLADQARNILNERVRRWPELPPPVKLEELELAVALAEMSAGNAEEAKAHLQASLDKRETTRALIQMGQLHARIGQRDEAQKYFARALERTNSKDLDEARLRAQILEQMGDVQRAAGQPEQAALAYTEALALWEAALKAGPEEMERAFGEIRRGVLLSRLSRQSEALDAFELAMQAVPYDRETYAQILSFMVVGAPSLDVAQSILQRAQRQLTLDPEWRAYFSLWVQTIAGRTHTPVPAEVTRLLARLARSDTWWGRLAQFGAGTIDHQKLSSFAKTRGEQVEADFYEGARRLDKGELAEARAMFQRVLDSRMVSFFEFQMAQELMLLDDTKLSFVPQPTAPNVAPAPVKAAPLKAAGKAGAKGPAVAKPAGAAAAPKAAPARAAPAQAAPAQAAPAQAAPAR